MLTETQTQVPVWNYQQSEEVYGAYRIAKYWVDEWETTQRERPKDYEASAHAYWKRKLAEAARVVRTSPPEIPGCNVWACKNVAHEDGLCLEHTDGEHDLFRISSGFGVLEPVVLELEPITCPVCRAANPTDKHLIDEYFEMMKAAMGGMFKNNAAAAQNEVAQMLLERGVTHAPNIFGNIPIVRY